ncbi:MAG: EAL domain-containing protein [Erysipelotrichaceae bacterium]|nr:EAL domain-containing protein [Erysipelotrichaceae bacterium]
MRQIYSLVLLAVIIALLVCAAISYRSKKDIGFPLAMLLIGLLPPVIGNLIIIFSTDHNISLAGSYFYFLGMDMAMYTLLKFTLAYCNIRKPNKVLLYISYFLLAVDVVQLLLNPIFGHAFTTEMIIVEDNPYFRLVPFFGQSFHRIVDYVIFLSTLIVFLVKTIRTPRIYAEKYSVILISMILTGLWQTFYIFSRTPIDTSMVGFGFFGILVFYFSLYYRPVRLLNDMLGTIASDLPVALFFFDSNSHCIWANDLGIKTAGIKGDDFSAAEQVLVDTFPDVDFLQPEFQCKRSIGYGKSYRHYIIEKGIITDDRGRKAGSYLTVRDNTEEQKAIQEEIYRATHDSLTDLYVRDYLYEKIKNKLNEDKKNEYYIVYLDVKEFKIINDVYGKDFGDEVIKAIANWLRSTLPRNAIYGRIGGDTFGVLFTADTFREDMLIEGLNGFTVNKGDRVIEVNLYAGVYKVNENDTDVSVMFDRAHLALNTVRSDYNTRVVHYDDNMRQNVLWEQNITMQFSDAVKERQIVPYLQPIVDRNGVVVGAEALVRWNHPEYGLLPPIKFVPIFEKNGLICDLDRYMWRCACEIVHRWEQEYRNLFISVNISPRDFYYIDVVREFNDIISEYDVDPQRIRVEITETMMMSDVENRMSVLRQLKDDGFIVEMDDFGSGYSSLNLLKDMPVDVLKIDMAFLNDSKDEDKAQTILHNIITLSDELKIVSLTEGVETREQFDMLSKMGCKLFQGYNFSKPIPIAEFEETFLDKNRQPLS